MDLIYGSVKKHLAFEAGENLRCEQKEIQCIVFTLVIHGGIG